MAEELTPKEIEDSKVIARIKSGTVTSTAGKIVLSLLRDLNDRRGIKWALQEVEDDVMLELVQTHMKLAKSHIYLT